MVSLYTSIHAHPTPDERACFSTFDAASSLPVFSMPSVCARRGPSFNSDSIELPCTNVGRGVQVGVLSLCPATVGQKPPAPKQLYLTFLTTKASVAIFVNHFTNNWSLYLMLTAMPSCARARARIRLRVGGHPSVGGEIIRS